MKTIFATCIALAAVTCSCSGNRSQNQPATQADADSVQTAPAIVLDGKWNIDNVVVNDTLYARPSEETPDRKSSIVFEDGNYAIATNCNSIQGSYSVNGDSIAMNPGLCTEMACENMRVEDMLKKVLPAIRTVNLVNDSVVRLNGEASEYIVLTRAEEPAK